MYAYRARSLTCPWPPAFYGAVILMAWMLGRLAPIAVVHSHGWAPVIAGSVLIAVAVSLDIWAMRTLIDAHTTVMPYRCSTHLVTSGPYRLTRNPIYLGYTLMTMGFGLITVNPWQFIIGALAVILMTVCAVRSEELHLLSRFGVEFERYARRTSRWL